MKKGCLGCLGCGCLIVILSIVIPCVWLYHWADTSGRVMLADGLQKLTDEGSKYAFEPETASEIASLTKEIRDDLASGKLGVIDTYKYVLNNIKTGEKLQKTSKKQKQTSRREGFMRMTLFLFTAAFTV